MKIISAYGRKPMSNSCPPIVEGSTQMESEVLTQRDLGERVLVEQEGTTHRISVSSSNKRMFHLLKRAKVQLIKIDQQKQLKSSQVNQSRFPLCITCVSMYRYSSIIEV